jgi:hypothetical protein
MARSNAASDSRSPLHKRGGSDAASKSVSKGGHIKGKTGYSPDPFRHKGSK